MADIKVKLKNASEDILFPQSMSDIISHVKTNGDSTTVEAELNKLAALMISGGDLDAAQKALDELNEKSNSSHYGSLVELATFIENFMIDEGVVLDVIDTWEELEKFLQGITESDSLTGLLQLMYNRVNAEKSIVEGGDNISVKSEDVDTTYKDEHGDEVKTTYTKYTISAEGLATTSDIESIQSAVANAQDAAAAAQSSADEAATSASAAQAAADLAEADAKAAQETASAAQTSANNAQETAESAQSDINTLSESLDNYALKSDIPTKVSELDNDSGFITDSALDGYAKESDIPTKVSDLENDSGYITDEALADYATKDAVDELTTTVNDKQDKLSAVAPIAISEDNKISIDLDDYLTTEAAAETYLTKSDAEETYATQDALSEVSSTLDDVSTTANSAATQASTNAEAITAIQESITSLTATGVYYEEITN